jgi:5-methylcytosine-specific restriction endonuclease McrA
MPPRKRKALGLSSLVKKLDRVFSRYIRLKNADETGTVQCCTCGKLLHWGDSHASHFVSRRHMSVRFDERNVHVCCPRCNVFEHGALDDYSKYIIETYGMETFNELLRLKRVNMKWLRSDLEEMIAVYQMKTKQLELDRQV